MGCVASRRVNPLGGFVMEMACATRLLYQPKQIPPLVAHVSSLLDPTHDAGFVSPHVLLNLAFGSMCCVTAWQIKVALIVAICGTTIVTAGVAAEHGKAWYLSSALMPPQSFPLL